MVIPKEAWSIFSVVQKGFFTWTLPEATLFLMGLSKIGEMLKPPSRTRHLIKLNQNINIPPDNPAQRIDYNSLVKPAIKYFPLLLISVAAYFSDGSPGRDMANNLPVDLTSIPSLYIQHVISMLKDAGISQHEMFGILAVGIRALWGLEKTAGTLKRL